MSENRTREEMFQAILFEYNGHPKTVLEMRGICEQAGLFEDDPRIARAVERTKDRIVRELARQRGWVDKDGNPLELVNVIRPDSTGSGKEVHLYLSLDMATLEDHIYLVKDRLKKVEYFRSEARRYYDHGCREYGRKFQRLFQFD